MNGLHTEAQMQASLIEAKDVTIAELRRERDEAKLEGRLWLEAACEHDTLADRLDNELRDVRDDLTDANARCVVFTLAAFASGIALAVVVGWVV